MEAPVPEKRPQAVKDAVRFGRDGRLGAGTFPAVSFFNCSPDKFQAAGTAFKK